MQQIDHLPDTAEMALPEAVSQDLFLRLLESFDSVGEAKAFWREASSTIIILDTTDNITQLKESDTWNQIEFALTYPEYTLPLKMGYVLPLPMIQGVVFIWPFILIYLASFPRI